MSYVADPEVFPDHWVSFRTRPLDVRECVEMMMWLDENRPFERTDAKLGERLISLLRHRVVNVSMPRELVAYAKLKWG